MENNLRGIALYAFDEQFMTGKLIFSAYPDKETKETISFTKASLELMLNSEAVLNQFEKSSEGGFNNSIYEGIRDEDGRLIGLFKISTPMRETFSARIRFFVVYVPAFIILIIVFALLVSRAVKKRVIEPLLELNSAAREFGEKGLEILEKNGGTNFIPPDKLPDDEIKTLWQTCSDMERALANSVEALKTMTMEKERQDAEMQIATQIQTGMLPGSDTAVTERRDFSIAGSMTAAKGVGGDFYDYFMTDDDHLAMIIGDVSGKGIPASLFMVLSMTQIRMHSIGSRSHSPAEILKKAKRGICANNPEMMFVTVWMGILEISTGILRETNAGHEYPAVKRADGDYELDLSEHDMPMGLMEDMDFAEKERRLGRGDRIFLYSDGLPEANDTSDEQFGTDRMIHSLNKYSDNDDETLLENMKAAIADFTKGAPQFDDLTMLSFALK
jgi:sigma-B regulation protein RsbU (phosphoserine phosphatase)